MKKIFFLLSICSFTFSFCQEVKTVPITSFKKIQIGINFSPDLCFRTLKREDPTMPKEAFDEFKKEALPKFGFTTGINFCYNFKSFIGLETGIQYTQKGYQSPYIALIHNMPVIDYDPIGIKTLDYFHYLDIPLKINFTLGKKRLKFITSAGFSANFLLAENHEKILFYQGGSIYTKKSNSNETSYYNRFNLTPLVSVGIDYKINNQMNLKVEPTFRFSALQVYKNNSALSNFLWTAGLNMSYYFGL